MEKEYAITKSNLRMFQRTYGSMKRSEIETCFTQTPAVATIEMEVITRYIKNRFEAGAVWECTNMLYHYYNDNIAFGELINVILCDSGEDPGER